jgi:hypothetical protein
LWNEMSEKELKEESNKWKIKRKKTIKKPDEE